MRRVLVLGGSGGVGAAVVQDLIEAGYAVDTVFNRTRPPPSDMGRCFHCDLASHGARAELVSDLGAQPDPYYAMVHCAGAVHDALVLAIDDRRARDVMEVNYWSFVDVAKAILPRMTRAREGRIVAIGSIAATRARRGNAVYSASKAALSAFVRAASAELAGRGVTVNEIQAGFLATPMLAPYAKDHAEMIRGVPARRMGEPREIARLTRFLVSDDAAYITGASVVADGGLSTVIA